MSDTIKKSETAGVKLNEAELDKVNGGTFLPTITSDTSNILTELESNDKNESYGKIYTPMPMLD